MANTVKDHKLSTGITAGSHKQDKKALAAIMVTVLLWASAFLAIRSSGTYFEPGALAFGRLAVAAVVLLVILVWRGEGVPPRQAWFGITASGILWFGIYNIALNWGERTVDAGTAAMIINIAPLLIAILSGLILKEGLPPILLAGMAVSFVGVVLVGIASSDESGSSVAGTLLCLTAAVVYAVGAVLQKPALSYATPLQATASAAVIGAIMCLPFAGEFAHEIVKAPAAATWQVVYLGIFPTAIAFHCWAYAISRTTAGKTAAATYVVPVLVILMSWLLLGEVPSVLAILGGLLCLLGVGISRMRRKSVKST